MQPNDHFYAAVALAEVFLLIFICYPSFVIIAINTIIKARGADNFLHHNVTP